MIWLYQGKLQASSLLIFSSHSSTVIDPLQTTLVKEDLSSGRCWSIPIVSPTTVFSHDESDNPIVKTNGCCLFGYILQIVHGPQPKPMKSILWHIEWLGSLVAITGELKNSTDMINIPLHTSISPNARLRFIFISMRRNRNFLLCYFV